MVVVVVLVLLVLLLVVVVVGVDRRSPLGAGRNENAVAYQDDTFASGAWQHDTQISYVGQHLCCRRRWGCGLLGVGVGVGVGVGYKVRVRVWVSRLGLGCGFHG